MLLTLTKALGAPLTPTLFETGSHFVALADLTHSVHQPGLELTQIQLPLPSAPSQLAYF